MSWVNLVIDRIQPTFENDTSGHDWHHVLRVLNTARYLQEKEGGDLEVIELAALLHDISDHKFNGGKLDEGGKVAFQLLIELGADTELAEKVCYIVDRVSYKGAHTPAEMLGIEGQIVQDADRLDAIGALGVARTFAYGGHKGQAMYDPKMPSVLHQNFEEYANAKSTTINHFYEKLLLLTDRLNTASARHLGKQRHTFMEDFLRQFYQEWNFNSKQNG